VSFGRTGGETEDQGRPKRTLWKEEEVWGGAECFQTELITLSQRQTNLVDAKVLSFFLGGTKKKD